MLSLSHAHALTLPLSDLPIHPNVRSFVLCGFRWFVFNPYCCNRISLLGSHCGSEGFEVALIPVAPDTVLYQGEREVRETD